MKTGQLRLLEILGHRSVKECLSKQRHHATPFQRSIRLDRAEETVCLKPFLNPMLANLARRKIPCLVQEALCGTRHNVDEIIFRRRALFFPTNLAIGHVVVQIQFTKQRPRGARDTVPYVTKKVDRSVHDGILGPCIFLARTCQESFLEFRTRFLRHG